MDVVIPETTVCLAAVASRDRRFDGCFYTAVHTTGIYCRPSCPARTPKPENVTFYPSAAAAQDAGYRACRRCRPDVVPGSPEWDIRADAVARAMRLIADGVVDREGVPGLAHRVGYTVRHLQRLLLVELGATPVSLARSQRAHVARTLIETTDLALSEVAFAAGFGSIRSFNDAVVTTYGRPPRELRAHGHRGPHPLGALTVRLPFRRPFNPEPLFGHLVATAVPGVEEWRDGRYRRTLRLPHGPGICALAARSDHIEATFWLADPRDLTPAVSRTRHLLDLDADPIAVDAALADDPALAGWIAEAPGRRVPRTVDGAEFALRAVIGQQISTAAARTHTGRLVERFGEVIADPEGGLTHLFPTADALAGMPPDALAGPRTKSLTLIGLARALADGDIDLSPGADRAEARRQLTALPGIGPWTADIVAMRSLGNPDVLPVTDLGIRQGAELLGIDSLRSASERWRPWRSYASQYLWGALDHPINHLPR